VVVAIFPLVSEALRIQHLYRQTVRQMKRDWSKGVDDTFN
jgi:hypothetical protein